MAQVTIQPWIINMIHVDQGTTIPKIDLDPVFDDIKNIWGKQKIVLEIAKPEIKTIALTQKPEDYKKGELTAFLNKALEKDVNASFNGYYNKNVKVVQSIFVPYYDRWGLTFEITNKLSPYIGPVTFITTANAGVGDTILSNTRMSNSPVKLVNKAIGLDAAHEIGHAFKLIHTKNITKKEALMLEVLYNSFIKVEKCPDKKDAFDRAKKWYPTYTFDIDDIYKRQKDGDDYWTLLHGDVIDSDELKIVQNTISTGIAWKK